LIHHKDKTLQVISQHEHVIKNIISELKSNDPTVITSDYGTL